MSYHSYEDKASEMYEKRMEEVYSKIDTAKDAIEKVYIAVDDVEHLLSDEQHDKIESLISKAIVALCGV